MAFGLAEAVVKKMGEMAVQPALNEVSMLYNFTEDFEWLAHGFAGISSVLKEADEERSSQTESVRNWLHRVRDIAWEAEDILEECAADSLYATNDQFCVLRCKQLIFRHQMGTRIHKVKALLRSVVEDVEIQNLVRAAVPRKEAESSEGRQQRSSLLPCDAEAVGIQSKIESVVTLLENPQIPIIAVVGMGGIGKTYLLEHIYAAQKGRYEKSVWLSVSQFYSVSQLQRDLVFQLDEDTCKKISECRISEKAAVTSIRSLLQGKRCLFVLDDVWKASREDDLLAKLGIPSGETSKCKILVSTRDRDVCVNLNAEIYEMELLTEKESWGLFCAHAFPKLEENRPPTELEEVARGIWKKCGNLPLAIRITAASLASTAQPDHWRSKLSELEKVDTSNSDKHVMDILKLSYNSLPPHLKACFAYLSFFPEDEVIECQYLMHLWMGEGLIPARENPRNCLHQLVNLCLIKEWEEEWRMKKYCRVHDLLHDLAILISRENRCAFSVEDAFPKLHSPYTVGGRWRRLFLAKKDIDEHAISDRRPVSPTLVRTLSLSRNTKIGENIQEMLFSGMRVLRVLDLSYSSISALPVCVGKMKLLKVLNLSGTKIKKVPDSVRHLKSLMYLNLSECGELKRGLEAPKWISELQCLGHLEGPFEKMPNGISKLESLRTLRISGEWWLSLSMEENGMLRLEDVGNMRMIEEIRFKVEHEIQLKRMEERVLLAPLSNMRRLDITNKIRARRTPSDLPQFPESMNAMKGLVHLRVEYFVVPRWIGCLKDLTFLYLQNCDGSDYSELQAMPKLVSLRLDVNTLCTKLPKVFGKSKGFPRLRFFSIHDFPDLEVFPDIDDGGMPCLEKLELWGCKNLNQVGEGLHQLKSLKEVGFKYSGTDDLRETFKEGGVNWQKLKAANPHIIIEVLM